MKQYISLSTANAVYRGIPIINAYEDESFVSVPLTQYIGESLKLFGKLVCVFVSVPLTQYIGESLKLLG